MHAFLSIASTSSKATVFVETSLSNVRTPANIIGLMPSGELLTSGRALKQQQIQNIFGQI